MLQSVIFSVLVCNLNAFTLFSTKSAAFHSSLEMKVGLYFGTSTGNTEAVASIIADASSDIDLVGSIDDLKDPTAYDAFIFGTPTWHTDADTERSGTEWDDWLYKELPNFNFDGTKVAIYGVGDASSYSTNFCDAMGELYDLFSAKGAKFYGATPVSEIEFEDSKSIRDGKFVGMVFDEDNESDKSEDRAKRWIVALKAEGFPL